MSSQPANKVLSPADTAILETRARRLALGVDHAVEEETLQVGEFPLGGDTYAIPLKQLRAAVPLKMLAPVPLAPRHVVGVVRFQGLTITVLSLASLLKSTGWMVDPAVLLVVDAGHGHLIALDCEDIPKPTALPAAAVEQARVSATGPVLDVVVGNEQPVYLLDIARLLTAMTGGGLGS